MAKISLLNLKGEKIKDITLNDNIWNIDVNDIVLNKAVNLSLSSLRQGSHKTKTRAEVAGGGRKPWRQKGTGRARAGSTRRPIWVGGGHSFAITPRDYSKKMNRKEKLLALKSAYTYKFKDKELIVVDEIKLDSYKTKDIVKLLENFKTSKKVMFVTKEDNENLYMATRNLENVFVSLASEIGVLDLVFTDTLICDEASIKHIEEVLK